MPVTLEVLSGETRARSTVQRMAVVAKPRAASRERRCRDARAAQRRAVSLGPSGSPKSRRGAALLVMLGLGLGLGGCPQQPQRDPLAPDRMYSPTVVGVVESEEFVAVRTVSLTLDDGRVFEIDLGAATAVGGYPEPEPGYLLLYGEEHDGAWYVAISGNPSCFGIGARAIDHGDAIVFDFGLRVPKADDYDPGSVSGSRYSNPQAGFCLNERGEVTEYQR